MSAATAIVAGAALLSVAAMEASPRAAWATLVYTATIVAMFSISAAYHRVHWRSQSAQKWMKRVDHSMIFVFIAGSYTPFALLAMPPRTGMEVLTMVCAGAAAGVALKMLWPSAPRLVGVPLYLVLGYVAIWFGGTLLDGAGVVVVVLLVAGGVLYNVGALFYGFGWPNPWPHDVRLSRVLSCVHGGRGGLPLHRRLGRRVVATGWMRDIEVTEGPKKGVDYGDGG